MFRVIIGITYQQPTWHVPAMFLQVHVDLCQLEDGRRIYGAKHAATD